MSSAGIDTNVNIIINAEDNASSVVSSTTQTIEQRFKAHRTQLKAVRMEYELNHRGLLTTMRAMQSVGMVVNRALSIYNSWNLMQLRIQTANKNVSDSQRDLNQILDQFGRDSPEFRRAIEANKQALEDQKKAQDEARLGMALMVISMIADSTRIITTVIPRLRLLLGMVKTINRTPVITPTTPIGTPASTAIAGAGASATSALGMAGAGAIGAVGGYAIAQELIFPEIAKNDKQFAEKWEKSKQGDQYIVNVIVNTWDQAKQALDNAYKTFTGGQ